MTFGYDNSLNPTTYSYLLLGTRINAKMVMKGYLISQYSVFNAPICERKNTKLSNRTEESL